MYVEIVNRFGEAPLRVPASQVVIKLDDGTPISVAALYGSEGSYCISHCKDKDFNRILKTLHIDQTVICDDVSSSAPPEGARLILGPNR